MLDVPTVREATGGSVLGDLADRGGGTGGALTGGVAVDGVGASFRKGGAALKRGCCDGVVFGGVTGGRTGAGGGGGRRSLLGTRLVLQSSDSLDLILMFLRAFNCAKTNKEE